MAWWGWIVAGGLLLAAELLVPADFYLVFLGVSALAVGGLAALGLQPSWLQWVLFAVFAAASTVAFRRSVRGRFREESGAVRDNLVGEWAVLSQTLAPGAHGSAELRGTVWNVRNAGEAPLAAGTRARVERVEGLLLHLRSEP